MKETSSWMAKSGPQGDIVLGTRVRLARNIRSIPFPATAERDQLREVLRLGEEMVPVLQRLGEFSFLKMAEVESLEREVLVEKHLISPRHTENPQNKGVILGKHDEISIMVNEEDHFRIQVLEPGLQLEQAWQMANAVDDCFEKNLDYAFDPELGFLTACPTNVGTALRASVMFHLPALKRVNQVNKVLGTVSKFGLTVRGLYGEGSDVWGNIYQLSNQVTMGHSEEETIEYLNGFTEQILHSERQAREYLMEENRRLLTEDQLYRSYGVLTHARSMSSQEAMELLSDLKLGVDLGIIQDIDSDVLKQLIVQIRAAHLQKMMGQPLPAEERDRLRASLIRETLSK